MKAPAFLSAEQTTREPANAIEQKQIWLTAVDRLLDEVEQWASLEPAWNISRD